MTYDYSYMGVVDGENGNLLWSFNCSIGAMASGVTVKNKKKGHDGMLFFANGCEGERQRMKRDSFEQDICPRMYIEVERATCKAQKRNKRHEEHEKEGAMYSDTDEDTNDSSSQSSRMPDIDYNQVLNAIPKDIWEIRDETDSFPDPWTDSYSFMQDYCEIPVDMMTTRVYYLTPNLITSGNIKPIYEFKPYVCSKCAYVCTTHYFIKMSISHTICTSMHTHTQTYIHTQLHTYIQTHIHTHTQTYIHTYVRMYF